MLLNKVVLNMNFENQLKECDELYEKQDYEALIEKCDEILGQFPYNPNAICYKGVSLHKLGETDEALGKEGLFDEIKKQVSDDENLKFTNVLGFNNFEYVINKKSG